MTSRAACLCVMLAIVGPHAFAACPVSETAPIGQLRAEVARLTAQGQRPDAISCLQREITRRESADPQLAADLRLELGKLLDDAGDFSHAKTQLEHAKRAFEQGARRPQLAEATRRLGWVEYRLADYTSAEAHLRHAVELHIAANGPRSIEVGRALNSLGVVRRDRGEYDSAERTLNDALAIAASQSDHDHQDLKAVTHNNLAGLWYYRSDFRRAIEQYDAARRLFIATSGERTVDVAMVYNNLAYMYQEVGSYADAERWYALALPLKTELFGPDHPTVASTIANIGLLADTKGQPDAARDHYARARLIYVRALGDKHPNVASVDTMIGELELRAGNVEQARESLEHAVAIREQAIGPDSTWVAEALNSLGPAYQALGRPADARSTLERSIVIALPGGEAQLLWKAYAAYADVLERQEAHGAAVFFGKQAVNIIQEMRAELATLGPPIQRSFLAAREPTYRRLADRLISLGRIPEAQQVLNMLKEEEYVDYLRARSSMEDMGATRASFTSDERTLAAQLASASDALKRAQEPRARGAARAGVADAIRRINATFATRSAAPALSAGAAASPSESIAPGTAAIRYAVMPDRVRILATTRTRQWQSDAPLSTPELNKRVFAFRQQLQNPRSDPRAPARELYEYLFAPLVPNLESEGVRRLVLIEDGTLRYLPFAALFDGERYLVERYEVIVETPVISGIADSAPRPQERVAAFGVSKGTPGFGPLPRVATELDRIVRRDASDRVGVLPGILALDEDFTAARFREALAAGYPAVHVASHFVFRPGAVGESYLLLGAGKRLTLDELRSVQYPLRNVQLLTLSACETAIGQPDATGREFESFGVLAQRQGARAVLATLWPVADLSTANFMGRFYRERLTAGSSVAALRNAQLAFLSRNDARALAPFRHPFYWAPYVLMGSNSPRN
jgi:CHAT domain-containing protein